MSTNTDIVNAPVLIDDAALTAISSYDDALKVLDTYELPVETMADYGTGFTVVEKETLLGIPLVIIQWRFNEGEYGEMVSVEAVTKHGEKVIFNDGSTGVRDDLKMVTRQRIERAHPAPQAGLVVAGGLTKTSYYYNEDTKETSKTAREGKAWKPASTYYLAS